MKNLKDKNYTKNHKISSEYDFEGRINTDPFGSWTGKATDNIYEEPVQDVDDL